MQERRLAVIMFTDIVGCSALMNQNEARAIHLLEKNRNLHKTLIDLYHGKYLKEIGDDMTLAFLGVNQKTTAIEYLEQAYQDREVWIPFMASDRRSDFLLDEPDFKNIMVKTEVISR